MNIQMLFVGRKYPYYQMIEKALGKEWRLLKAISEKSAGQIAEAVALDVAVVDGTSPRVNIAKVVERLRSLRPAVSLVVITPGRSGKAFDPPGALVLRTPFSQEELLQAVRRAGSQRVESGPFVLDLHSNILETPLGSEHLTPKEAQLMALFFRNADRVISRKEILRSIWETDFVGYVHTLYVHIRWLRKKIEPDPSRPRYIVTVRGVGYRFNPNGRVD